MEKLKSYFFNIASKKSSKNSVERIVNNLLNC
jgi:hypothetical protein